MSLNKLREDHDQGVLRRTQTSGDRAQAKNEVNKLFFPQPHHPSAQQISVLFPLYSRGSLRSFLRRPDLMADLCSSSSRARPSSSLSSLPFLLLATLLLLSFIAVPSLALAQPPHGSRPNHLKKTVKAREITPIELTIPQDLSPRPTPEPVAGGLERLRALYANKNTSLTESTMTKRANCVGNGTTIAQFNGFFATRGINTILLLCPGSVFNVTDTILFAFTGQGLQTEGGSSVPWDQRAKLIITSPKIATAIQATGCKG